MKKVLVLGGAGFIGVHTAAALAESGYVPIIVDNFSNSDPRIINELQQVLAQTAPNTPASPPIPIKCHEFDLRDEAALRACIDEEQPVAAIHFAAYKDVEASVNDPTKYYQNNIGSLASVLASSLTHVVFSSSCSVHGEVNSSSITEDSPFGTIASPYARTKQIGEALMEDVYAARTNFSGVSLRYFNPIGAHPSGKIGEWPFDLSNLVPVMLAAAHRGGTIRVYGTDYPTKDGTCVRDYLHVMDLAAMHVRALDWLFAQSHPVYEVFNCGTGMGTSVHSLIKMFNGMLEEPSQQNSRKHSRPVLFVKAPRRAGDLSYMVANIEKSKAYGLHVQDYTLQDALLHAWQWDRHVRKILP